MEVAIILAAIVLIPLAYFGFKWYKNRQPKGWFAGPIINGKNRSVGKFKNGKFVLGELHYLTKACGPLSGSIRCKYRFEGNARSVENGEPVLSLYFQRKGLGWSAEYAHYRWYSSKYWPLKEGENEVIYPLDFAYWIATLNRSRTFENFALAKGKAERVGLVTGHPGGRGHGVDGNGTLTLLEYGVLP